MPKKQNYTKMLKQDQATKGHKSRDRTRMFLTPGLLQALLSQVAKNWITLSVRATVKL